MKGIYKITNPNGKIYIGYSNNIESRKKVHERANIKNTLIHKSIKKYGWDNHVFEVLVSGDFTNTFLQELEKHYIQLYCSYAGYSKKGLNLTKGGEGTIGFKVSNETKNLWSIQRKGHKRSEESITKQKQFIKENESVYILAQKTCRFIVAEKDGIVYEFPSISNCAKKLGIDRKDIYNHFEHKRSIKGYKFYL
jgi:hypothetical protein